MVVQLAASNAVSVTTGMIRRRVGMTGTMRGSGQRVKIISAQRGTVNVRQSDQCLTGVKPNPGALWQNSVARRSLTGHRMTGKTVRSGWQNEEWIYNSDRIDAELRGMRTRQRDV